MPLTFETDSNNDLMLGNDGNFSMISGLDAVIQQCEEVMETLLGELIYDKTKGIDYDSTAFAGSPDFVKFERQARAQLGNVDTIQNVTDFTLEIVGDTLSYRAIIDSTLGTGNITNVV